MEKCFKKLSLMLNAARLSGATGFRNVKVAGDLDVLFLGTMETKA